MQFSPVDPSLTVKPVELFELNCSNSAVKLITLVMHFYSVEAFNLVKPCELPRPIKSDCAVCAVDPIKLAMHFYQLENL